MKIFLYLMAFWQAYLIYDGLMSAKEGSYGPLIICAIVGFIFSRIIKAYDAPDRPASRYPRTSFFTASGDNYTKNAADNAGMNIRRDSPPMKIPRDETLFSLRRRIGLKC